MGFIYKITNKVNDKVYIGKTEETVEKRFKQHLSEYNKDRSKNRPLYRAIKKYGKENFEVSLIEETEDASNREIFWIDFYDSYENGYNATKGGDGSPFVDKELILYHLQNTTKNCAEVARITGYDRCTCSKVAKDSGIFEPHSRGTNKVNSVLTEELVLQIRNMYIPKKFGKRKIAEALNLSADIVANVIRGKAWVWLD